jgi:anthranilate phosphoribosyltransferase
MTTPATVVGKKVAAMLSGTVDTASAVKLLSELDPLGLSADELADAARVMLSFAKPFPAMPDMIDTCGTGGDGAHTRNVSTACAFVLAACDVMVVKHGNRAVSSKSGSADVLAALGINLSPREEQTMKALQKCNLAFIFAPDYHPNLSHVREARSIFGKRSIFNVLGPLCNPARIRKQLLGVYDKALLNPVAHALIKLGVSDAMVVHAHDGLDEISISAPTDIARVLDESVHLSTITPEDAGLSSHPAAAIAGGDAQENSVALRELLRGRIDAYADAVVLNCAGALQVAQRVTSWHDGVAMARRAIECGRALEVYTNYQEITA